MIIEYTKTREDLKSPSRANPSDAGLDIYADLPKTVSIEPGGNAMIPTGLKFGIPHGFMLQVCNRGSMGAKRSLIVGAHIIDAGYDGEVFIDLHNIGQETQKINHGDKIAQVIMVPVIHFRAVQLKSGELYDDDERAIAMSARGEGALGSTDDRKRSYSSTADLDMRDRFPQTKSDSRPANILTGSLAGWMPNGF
jgi:dUTP pyrophosphatase